MKKMIESKLRYKRNTVATLVLAASSGVCALLSDSAHAQSSVTLYGIIDTGLSYVNNASTGNGHASLVKYADSVATGSRWGLTGKEDLGQGLKAIFTVENGFDTGTGVLGNGGAEFGRQAFVGLQDNKWGTLTFGRQYSLSASILGHGYSMGSLTHADAFAYHINDLDGLTGSRFSNAIKYVSTSHYGFTVGGMYGFSNQAGAFAGAPTTTVNGVTTTGSSRAYSFAVEYEHGPFGAAGMYSDIRYPGLATPSAFTTLVANVATNGSKDIRTFGFGTHYKYGSTTMAWANYTNTRFLPVTGGASLLSAYEIGAYYNYRPDTQFALGYTFEHLGGAVSGRWHQVNAVFDYFLSKRTDLYFLVSYQKALGENRVGGVEVPVQAQIGSSTSFIGTSGLGATSQIAVHAAIRHTF